MAGVFVTYSGMNSTMESLYYGVPRVGLPQMPEQMITAQRVKELGLGTVLDMNTLTVGELHDTVKAALSNAEYRKNTQAMQQYVRSAGDTSAPPMRSQTMPRFRARRPWRRKDKG